MPGLASFVEHLEDDLFDEAMWRREVFDVIDKNMKLLNSWAPDGQQGVLKAYSLQGSECIFLHDEDHPTFPDSAALRLGPAMPIPCLHRIHKDEDKLSGAHYVQERIGMSISLSDTVTRLRQLSVLKSAIAGCRANPTCKALVTMDDGFRDVHRSHSACTLHAIRARFSLARVHCVWHR
jgi:hypothetical protein